MVVPCDRDVRGNVVPGRPIEAPDSQTAVRRAERLASRRAGAVAFARTGDTVFGEWDEAVVLGRFGRVPDEVVEQLKAA